MSVPSVASFKNSRQNTLVRPVSCSKMADGSSEEYVAMKQMNNPTFSVPDPELGDTKKCCEQSVNSDKVKLSFYTEQKTSESCETSGTNSVVDSQAASTCEELQKPPDLNSEFVEDRKKRCFDRYDSSESSDSGVVVLSSTENSGCSSSDITEPASPRSPESACSSSEEGASPRMPPWASEPAPPQAARRIAAQPAPVRRPNPPLHRRITEYFNQKMKPQNGIKRDCSSVANDDSKRKCLPRNGVTHDLEKYISYLSQTLNPKLLDVGNQPDQSDGKSTQSSVNGVVESYETVEPFKKMPNFNGLRENEKTKDGKGKARVNGLNGMVNGKMLDYNSQSDPNAKGHHLDKMPIPVSSEIFNYRAAPTSSVHTQKNGTTIAKPDSTKANGIVSSTTKLDCRMNGVTCGSNNINLNLKYLQVKKEPIKKTMQPAKRTNRKSSACIANSKKMTWSKANNLKQQVQMQKQNCVNTSQSVPIQNNPGEANTAPKVTIPNGVRQISMTLNGNLGNMNMPLNNLQNCHQLNIPQSYNGTVTSPNLASFVAVPQNVMLTTLRIPQNGLPSQTMNQQNNMNAFNKSNVNVNSPTKLNGQFVFPFVQNINGTVVQIPNLMAKMPNFMLPQAPQIARQDHLQNQQATQFLINGTLLKLANTVPQHYPNSAANKPSNISNQSLPTLNKNMPGVQPVGMTVHAKPNYTVNHSYPVLMPQQGYIVTSVPNVNVKETWSCNSTNVNAVPSTQQPICSHPILQHTQPILANFATQHLHSSSIPISQVKPPDNPIQGTDPPSSTVVEPEFAEMTNSKCDIPWLSKTVNNNIVPFVTNKNAMRPFAEVSSLTDNIEMFVTDKLPETKLLGKPFKESQQDDEKMKMSKKVEEIDSNEDTVFTDIIVKDVISDVHNSVMEANFCSTTMESSESGIGTDKSIDSPSDSQTSKECDEDSSLSLSISVCSLDVQSSQKSPILKQPKTLRFPPRSSKPNSDKRTSSTDTTSTVTLCLWENCSKELDSDSDLLEHLQSVHVETQAGRENYVCLWRKCKVRGKPSCSRLWLERHTQSHGGNKPFKCIVDGCDKRWSTQILLERHVNTHFNETTPNSGSGKKTSDSAAKLIRRNGKKLRYRRQPWSARMFDFFDSGIMEGLVWRLVRSTKWRLGVTCPLRDMGVHSITLQATLMATRYNATERRKEALLTYNPPHVVEDEWVPEKDVKRIKRVEISQLSTQTKVMLYEQFCASYKKPPTPQPVKKTVVTPSRSLPIRQCTSSRLLNNLLSKKNAESKPEPVTGVPPVIKEEEKAPEVSGAKKRKLGRRYGGNAFWPCGR